MVTPRTLRRPLVLLASLAALAGVHLVVLAGPAAAASRYEAENATISQGVVESNHTGFSGTGFVNGDNVAGSYTQFTFTAATAGAATLVLRYANGTGAARTADVAVDGTVVAAGRSFAATADWDTWASATFTADVAAGSHTLRITATGSGGNPNLDYLDVTVAAPSTVYQAENATLSQADVATNHTGYTGGGFVDYVNTTGGYIEWNVTAASAGAATVTLRYANGTSIDRPLALTVNGAAAGTRSYPATANWDTWADDAFTVNLAAGANTIRATATTANGGPNVDKITISVAGGGDTQPPTTPGTPSCGAITTTGLTLSWGASTDNVGVVAYDIYNDGNKLAEAPGSQTSTALTGFTPNTQYRLSVFGRDAAGNVSIGSQTVACTTLAATDGQAPTAPSGLTGSNVTANSVRLAWTGSTDNVGVTSYEVRSGDSVYATVTGTPPATSATVTGLACASPYTLAVVALDAAGNVSAASNAVSFTTSACGSSDGGVPSSVSTISSGWTIPWGLYWMPDGQSALATERDDKVTSGQFKVFKVSLTGARTQVGTVPNVVTTGGEGGLLGVAVDPNWASNHYVYFFHTASEGNRIVRMTYNGTSLSGYTILVQGIKKNKYHNGGRLAFGPDGYLYASTGDAQTSSLAQDTTSLNGKILRMRTDGTPAPGNPFGTLVYSYGHRNPQGLAFDRNGRLWEAEFGNSQYDELNLIKPGANYGWPTCEGTCSVSGMTNPKKTWPVDQASPSGIAIVRNVIYMAALRGERLWRIPISGDTENVGTATAYYVGTYGRLRTVVKVPGADQLWLTTTNCDNNGNAANGSDKVFRISIT
ncbi:PQQ-dependent sugar dehydrogenase [Microbispora sp. ATCC PTA-5024]|uniref:PQQ-dependent sugar dehydrogenase n=1 Tax=Microbispora sp. ATCC PTA-5024 TaxID=316330 RepID=UPI0003DD143A|nr:PQQ-dependent sugar dehydrogenase [Microbispora sp. ATCC PTA-5024]ETK33760.1 oxidoreductase [Microbispora sp. ATCC PTA-5024]